MAKKILIAAGGTGGHLFPALSLAENLKKEGIEVFFAASRLSTNPHFEKKSYPFQDIRSSTLSLSDSWRLIPKGFQIILGLKDSLKLLKSYQPDFVLGFGSYHSLPIILAAQLLHIPFALNEQNVLPGRVNRLFMKSAKIYYTHYPSNKTLSNETHIAFPLRFKKTVQMSAEDQKKKLGLDPDKKTLFIFGGSQGADRINKQVIRCLPFLNQLDLQVIHLTGKSESLFSYEKEYSKQFKNRYLLKVFEEHMDKLYEASDFVISRAGASTVHELIEFEKPALLIPYPYASHHQLANARFFEQQVGGGEKLIEKDLTDTLFCDLIQKNLSESSLQKHNQAIKRWKQMHSLPPLAEQLYQEIHT